jgi:hypothetical protein
MTFAPTICNGCEAGIDNTQQDEASSSAQRGGAAIALE